MLTMIFMTSFYRTKRNNDRHGLTTGFPKAILLVFTLLTVIFSSCTQDPTKIGIGILPDEDFVNIYATDTIGVKTYTMYDEQSISADSTRMFAGGIYDEYFGTTHCDFVTQLRLIAPWPHQDFEIDSVLLQFVLSDVSGDTTAVHHIRLYETGTLLTDTTDYYSGQDPDTIKFLGEYPMPVLVEDSTYSVRLPNSVAEYLLRDTTKFLPATEFYTTFFKGLYFGIRSETNPVLITMAAEGSPLAITVFYHNPSNVSYSYSFVATNRAVNYNRFTHDFTTAAPDKQIKHINDLVPDTATYLQAFKGVYTRLDLPSLSSFRGTARIAVNKARLYVPVHIDAVDFPEKDLPTRIYLRYRDSKGHEVAVPDLIHDVGFLDGTYYNDKDYYIFNITSFVQLYLEGVVANPSVEMYYPLASDSNVIFKANSNDPTVKFEFVYTIY
jgi:hypothetical protein